MVLLIFKQVLDSRWIIKIIFILSFLIITVLNAFGQQIPLERTYPPPQSLNCHRPNSYTRGNDLVINTDSTILVLAMAETGGDTCTQFSADNIVLHLLKLNHYGDTLWTEVIMNPITNPFNATYLIGYSLTKSMNDYVIAGETEPGIYNLIDAILIKLDSSGNLLWRKEYYSEELNHFTTLIETQDLGYLAGGNTSASFGANQLIYVVKTDSDGNEQWSQTYGNGYFGNCNSIIDNQNGTYTLLGEIMPANSPQSNYQFLMLNIDSVGNELSRYTFGDTGSYQRCFKGIRTVDNNYVMVGEKVDVNERLCIIKSDYSGNVEWSKVYGDSLHAYWAQDVTETCDSGFVITGGVNICHFTGSQVTCDTVKSFLTKLDKNGNKQWERIWGHPYKYHGGFIFRMKEFFNNGYIAAGYNDTNAYVVHFDSLNLCNTTAIHDPQLVTNNITIYPNPTNGAFSISFPEIITNGNIEVFNILGEQIFRDEIILKDLLNIRLSNPAQGIYFVKINDAYKNYCKKIIIQ